MLKKGCSEEQKKSFICIYTRTHIKMHIVFYIKKSNIFSLKFYLKIVTLKKNFAQINLPFPLHFKEYTMNTCENFFTLLH